VVIFSRLGLAAAALALCAAAPVYGQSAPVSVPPRVHLERLVGLPALSTFDGALAEAQVANVTAMALAPDGAIYVADRASLRRVAGGFMTTVAGVADQPGTADGPAAQARFSAVIGGVAVTSDGTVYVADADSHTIRALSPSGDVRTVAGLPGQAGVAHGRGAAARFTRPVGVAVGADQSVYIVDEANTVRRLSLQGEVHLMAFVPSTPLAVAVEPSGAVLVASANRAIYRVTQNGEVSTLVSGLAPIGGLTVTPQGRVWLLEYFQWTPPPGCCNAIPDGENRIREISADGRLTLIATLDPRHADGGLSSLVVDHDGVAYLMNGVTRRLERIAADGTVTPWVRTAVQQTGFGLLASDVADGLLTITPTVADGRPAGQLRRATATGVIGPVLHTTRFVAAAVVRQGNSHLFIDGPSIGRLSQDGQVSLLTTLPYGAHMSDLAAAPDGTVVATVGGQGWAYLVRVAADGSSTVLRTDMFGYGPATVSPSTGDIFVVDAGKRAIRRYQADGSGGTVVVGQLSSVTRLRSSPDGSVYILDGVYLRQLTTDGELVTLWRSPDSDLQDVEVSPSGDVYLLKGGAIYRVLRTASASLMVLTPPADANAVAGGSASFTVSATGGPTPIVVWQESRDGGSTWTTLPGLYGGAFEGDRLVLPYVTRQMHGYQYRASLADADETLLTAAVTLSVSGMSATPGDLRFGVVRNATTGAVAHVSPPQEVRVVFTDGAPAWTVSASVPWIQVVADTSAGAGAVSVSVVDLAAVSDGAVGAVMLRPTDVSAPALTIPVALTVGSTAPIGQVDTPAQGALGLQGSIAMTGWAVDDVGVQHVRIYRQCLPFDDPQACQTLVGESLVLLGTATQISGARPDVEALYPAYPAVTTAGWGFLILSNLLPSIPAADARGGGVGTFRLYAVATDIEGHVRLLGRSYLDSAPEPTTVTAANDTIAKPFGAIDTPTQGGLVYSGFTDVNFGWVLTPDSNTVADATDVLVPTSGTTITVIIDGQPVGTATYNLCRGTVGNPVPEVVLCDDDVSAMFRGAGVYRNLDAGRGAIGLFQVPVLGLTNGLHTIQWSVTDSAGRSEGIGSRYFRVANNSAKCGGDGRAGAECGERRTGTRDGGAHAPTDASRTPADLPLYARTGFDLARAFTLVDTEAGVPTIRVPELGRVELQLPGVVDGVLVVNGELRDLPVGMALNSGTGTVTWSVGPGYLGSYRLRFAGRAPGTDVPQFETHWTVDLAVVVAPQAVVDESVRMHVDRTEMTCAGTPTTRCLVALHGWSLDPGAETGSGVGAVHMWGTSRSAECGVRSAESVRSAECAPVFLGTATLGIARPDVRAAHGARFERAGWVFTRALEPGDWDITAYVWVTRTGRFEDARSTRVTIR
jgi:hypothetical protein